jgi:hypothetical protein
MASAGKERPGHLQYRRRSDLHASRLTEVVDAYQAIFEEAQRLIGGRAAK